MKKLLFFIFAVFSAVQVFAQIRYIGTRVVLDNNDKYKPIPNGFILLKTGEYITGPLNINSHTIEVATNNKNANGQTIYKTKVIIDGFKINESEYPAVQVALYGQAAEYYVKDLCEYTKKGKLIEEKDEHANFHPGFIMLDDSVKLEGYVAIRSCVLFAKTLEDKVMVSYNLPYAFYRPFRVKHAVQRIEDKEYEFSPYIDYEVVKTNKWDKAILTLPDGKVLNGVANKNGKYTSQGIKSFRTLSFRPDGKYLNLYMPGEVKSVVFLDDDDKMEYLSFGEEFCSKKGLKARILEANYKDEELNFQDGAIYFYDGTVKKGKIARVPYMKKVGFFYVDEKDDLYPYYADKRVRYFTQNINGKEKRFIRIRNEYTEWFHANGHYSYFKNPFPTHPKKGLNRFTNFMLGAVSAGAQFMVDTLSKVAAVENYKKNKDLTEAAKAIDIGDQLEEGLGGLNEEELVFFHTEYVVLENERNPTVVYVNNLKEIMSAWMLECPEFATFDQKLVSRLQDIDHLNESVDFLNSKHCFR